MQLNRIKELRSKTKFSQADMADALNISQNAYSLIENGITRLIDTERIIAIANKLSVHPLDLGLFDCLQISQQQKGKIELGESHTIGNVHATESYLLLTLKDDLLVKNKQIEGLMYQMESVLIKR